MKRTLATTCALLLLACGTIAAQDGWVTLFNGKDLNQFVPLGTANWRLADGAVEANSGMGFLVTKQSYGNHEIRAEVWASPEGNSGIFIRCQNPGAVTDTSCYEINVYDTRPDQTYRTGGIVNLAKPLVMVNAANQWNRVEITANGPRLHVRWNGMTTVDVQDTKFTSGPFALQANAGTIRFRNVQVRELK